MLLLNGGQTANAAGKDDADLFGFRFGVQTAVCNRFSGGSKGQNGKAGHLAGFLFVHDGFRVKALHLACQLAFEIGGIELGNGADAAFARFAAAQLSAVLLPSGFTVPRPVITTLRFSMRVFSFYIAMPPSAQSTCPVR